MGPDSSIETDVARDVLFESLRVSMRSFARLHRLGDLDVVASDLADWGDGSWDPVYKIEFEKLLPDERYKLGTAMLLLAQFIRSTVGDRIAGSREFADALQMGSSDVTYRPGFLTPFFRRSRL